MATPGAATRQATTAETLRENQARIEELEALVAELRDQMQMGPRGVSPGSSSISSSSHTLQEPPDAKVNFPDEFEGKSAEYENFMAQCHLVFAARPREYHSDERKVLLVVSLLRGTPLSWAKKIALDPKHPLRQNWTAFKSALDKIYEDRNSKWKLGLKLLHLKQNGSAEAYAAAFQSLAASLDINDDGLCLLFYDGLKSSVKDALAPVPLSWMLNELVDQAVGADQRVHQREVEEGKARKTSATASQTSAKFSGKPNNGKRPHSYMESANDSRPANSNASSEQRGTSSAEKKRRQENPCKHCGKLGHFSGNCYYKPKSNSESVSLIAVKPASQSSGKA